jgi:formylglycine-generating enzyme required for sulfatase activity
LPTDAEREYAARFDDERIYPWGSDFPNCGLANFRQTSFCVGWTSPVGDYPDAPAALGLSDMAGNVHEWCNDRYENDLGTSPVTDPTGLRSGGSRMFRGGSWLDSFYELRCASRFDFAYPDGSPGVFGFRVSRTVNP